MVSAQIPALLVVNFMYTCFIQNINMYVNVHNFEDCIILFRGTIQLKVNLTLADRAHTT